jgi:hypothetical protein
VEPFEEPLRVDQHWKNLAVKRRLLVILSAMPLRFKWAIQRKANRFFGGVNLWRTLFCEEDSL